MMLSMSFVSLDTGKQSQVKKNGDTEPVDFQVPTNSNRVTGLIAFNVH